VQIGFRLWRGGPSQLPPRAAALRLPEGDFPAPAGAGVSNSAASDTSWRCWLRMKEWMGAVGRPRSEPCRVGCLLYFASPQG
jgi:hypothetical protein